MKAHNMRMFFSAIAVVLILLCMGCSGNSSSMNSIDTGSPTTEKQASAQGFFTFVVPPTPQTGTILYDDFTVKLDSYATGGIYYYVRYRLEDSSGNTVFSSYNFDTWDFEQVVQVPDNYFGYARIYVDLYAFTGSDDQLLDSDFVTYIVNTF